MKKGFLYGMSLMLSLSLMSATCLSNDDDEISNIDQEISQIESVATTGTWVVSSFVDSGEDETSDFNGYTFTFLENGTITATNGTTTYEGTWHLSLSSDDNDDDDNDIDFNISFPVPETNDFEDLNDDWDVVSHSNSTISLIDISGGNGGTDTLIFEKNN